MKAGWEILDTEGLVQPSKACIEVELKGQQRKAAGGD